MKPTGNVTTVEARLTSTFAALADPTRRALLAMLARRESSVLELTRPFSMTQPAISKHLKVLERVGLVSRRRDAQRRPCRLEAAPLAEAANWLKTYRRFWEGRFRHMEALLAKMTATPKVGSRVRKSKGGATS